MSRQVLLHSAATQFLTILPAISLFLRDGRKRAVFIAIPYCARSCTIQLYSPSWTSYIAPPKHKAHTNERFISCDGHQLYICLKGAGCRSRSRGLRCIAGRKHDRPASFKGFRSRTKGRSQCVLVKIWRSTLNTYLVWSLNVIVR